MKLVLKKIRISLLAVPLLVVGLSFIAPASLASAACDTSNLDAQSGANCAQGNNTPTTLFGQESIFTTVVNILLFLVGAIAVIMLIYGGIKYVTSGGAQDQVTSAKNTIMYAIVGIVVALLAFAVVNFVVGGLSTTT